MFVASVLEECSRITGVDHIGYKHVEATDLVETFFTTYESLRSSGDSIGMKELVDAKNLLLSFIIFRTNGESAVPRNFCRACEGLGYTAKYKIEIVVVDCPKCHGSGYRHEKCKLCGGRGKRAFNENGSPCKIQFSKRCCHFGEYQKSIDCKACDGKGSSQTACNYTITKTCTTCRGKGTFKYNRSFGLKGYCPECKGSGAKKKPVQSLHPTHIQNCDECRGTGSSTYKKLKGNTVISPEIGQQLLK